MPVAILAQTGVTTETRHRLELAGMPSGWWAVLGLLAVVLLVYAVVWLYRHEGRAGVSPRGRWLLTGIRLVVVGGLVLIWLEPVLGVYVHRRTLSETLVLVDTSASMGIADRYADAGARDRLDALLSRVNAPVDARYTRAELAHLLLSADDGDFLNRLAARNKVKLFTFDEFPRHRATLIEPGLMVAAGGEGQVGAARRVGIAHQNEPEEDSVGGAHPTAGVRPPSALEAFAPTGPVTNIGRAVREAVEASGSTPVAGVVILSDGAVNQGEPVDVVGQFARSKQIPLWVVGIGDPARPRNVRVTEILAPQTVFLRDPFTVTAHISSDGMGGERVPVELALADDAEGSAERVLETKYVDVPSSGEMTPVTFRHAIDRAGEVTVVVRVPPQAGEVLVDDNRREEKVRIIENKLRVLLVAGSPTWEYRYVSRLLERDTTFDLSCWLQSADVDAVRDGNTVIDHLPTDPAELYAYDVLLLLDPNPRELDAEWCRNAATLVGDHFGGLVLAAGRKFTPRFMREDDTRAVVEMLPVIYDPEAELEINRQGHFQKRAWPIAIPEAARDHPVILQTTDPAANAAIWARLGEVYWHYPVKRHKPLATVLMRHTNPLMRDTTATGEETGQVLLATQRFGTGRTAFLAIDSTWRWRRYGETYFSRFWVQLIRYVSEGKAGAQERRGVILTDREGYRMGEAVTVRARLLDAGYMPIAKDTFRATLTESPAGDAAAVSRRPLVLEANPNAPGWFQSRFIARRVGAYEIAVELPGRGGNAPIRVARSVRVSRPQIELARPQLDRRALVSLAESAGGRYFSLDEAQDIPDLIEDAHLETVSAGTPISMWDNAWTLGGLIVLLCSEWALRKYWRLL